MTIVDCPQCGYPAEIVDRFPLESTSGPVEHVRLRCLIGRHPALAMPAALIRRDPPGAFR